MAQDSSVGTATDVAREQLRALREELAGDSADDSLVERAINLIHAFPAMGQPLLDALAPHFPSLSKQCAGMLWETALRNRDLYYPEQAEQVLDMCLAEAKEKPEAVLEDLMLLRGGDQQARAFKLCHARAERIAPGSGRCLAGQIALRALQYPIVDYWVFTEAPLVTILEYEPAAGFEVAVAGGYLPWFAAWVMMVRDAGKESHDAGIRGTFQRLLAAGAELNADIPGGPGGLALSLACDGVDQAQEGAGIALVLLMDAGAQWNHLERPGDSASERLLRRWAAVRRERLGRLVCQTPQTMEAAREL